MSEVVESGYVGVTITAPTKSYTAGTDSKGEWNALDGTDGVTEGISTATNWDLFNSRDVSIKLHCTTDVNAAAKTYRVIGFN